VSKIRFELLSVEKPGGQRFGSNVERLFLGDVMPFHENRTGRRSCLEFSECKHPEFPNDKTLGNCIDFLSDTGWVVPPLKKGASSHELIMKFSQAITLRSDEFFGLDIDLGGGSPGLGVLSRIRV